jgi:hypothetical protein
MGMTNNQHYDTYEKRLDTVLGAEAQDWARIRRARTEFNEEFQAVPDIAEDDKDFVSWLAWTYGIKLTMAPNHGIENNFQITDAQKYTVFLLKFS